MANKNVEEVVTTEVVETLKLPDNQYKLSSGVIVEIVVDAVASSEVIKNLMLNVFKVVKLEKNGTIKEGGDSIEKADKIIQLQDTLLSNFVTLVGSISEYMTSIPTIDKSWLKKLRRSNLLIGNLDLDDEDDVNYLFLKYVAFASPEDWQLLMEKTIQNQ